MRTEIQQSGSPVINGHSPTQSFLFLMTTSCVVSGRPSNLAALPILGKNAGGCPDHGHYYQGNEMKNVGLH
jgi:hypothetical protein